jgi:hypothetical protein
VPEFFDLGVVLFVCLAAALAFLVRGAAGFGANLVLAPLLASVLDVRQVVVVSTLLTLIVGAYLVAARFRENHFAALRAVVVPSGLACVAGAFLLSFVQAEFLLLALGVVSVVYAAYTFVTPQGARFKFVAESRASRLTFSGLSGLLHGLYGTGGPPIVILYSQWIESKEALRASLNTYFLVLDVIRAAAYVLFASGGSVARYLNQESALLSLLLLAPAGLGALAGVRLQGRFSETDFRRLVAVVLFLTGLSLIGRAWV